MANETQVSDLAGIIKDLMARRAALDAAITSLLAASGAMIPAGQETSGGGNGDLQPTELPRGAFLGKSIPAAVKLYLYAMKKKQTDREIAAALAEGGMESTSDNFEKVVTGCLNRMKTNGEVLRFKDGWGLAEFYPAHLRSSLSQEGVSKKKPAKKKAKKAATKKPAVAAPASASAPTPGTGLVDRMEAYVRGHHGEWVTLAEVIAAFPGNDRKMIALNLGKSAKKHGWEKSEDGKYRVGA